MKPQKIKLSSVSPTHKPTAIVEKVHHTKDKKKSILSIAIDGTEQMGYIIVDDVAQQKMLTEALEKDAVHMVEVRFCGLRLYKDREKIHGYADSYSIIE